VLSGGHNPEFARSSIQQLGAASLLEIDSELASLSRSLIEHSRPPLSPPLSTRKASQLGLHAPPRQAGVLNKAEKSQGFIVYLSEASEVLCISFIASNKNEDWVRERAPPEASKGPLPQRARFPEGAHSVPGTRSMQSGGREEYLPLTWWGGRATCAVRGVQPPCKQAKRARPTGEELGRKKGFFLGTITSYDARRRMEFASLVRTPSRVSNRK
jgi:hypothetical protein